MYKLYYLVSYETAYYYIGMTKSKLTTRLNQHRSNAKLGKKSALYDCMRKHDFMIVLVKEFDLHADCCDEEVSHIYIAKMLGHNILNIAPGGEGGFNVVDVDNWKIKLREKRRGRKPALGMKHTEENKKLFSIVSKSYWSTQETYKPEEVCKYGFKEAKELFGISKTHYYRLKKRLQNNEL